MKTTWKYIVAILIVTALAAAIRLPKLAQRPMHGDEAIHADKFGTLLADGVYKYDPYEYHGPTLNYFTLIPAWLAGQKTYQQINEYTVRIVPVFFGIMLVLCVVLIADGLGWSAAVFAAILTAFSHAMVFYSRYYIQEMLLVFFTFGVIICGYRYAKSKRPVWVIAAGVCMGLMHATKETFVIAVAAMVGALMLTLALAKRRQNDRAKGAIESCCKVKIFLCGIIVAAIVSAVLFSCFFRNPHGIVDSVMTYKTYLNRAGHNELHVHPWCYYLKMLLYTKIGPGPVWTEAIILVFAVVGFFAAIFKRGPADADGNLLRFIAFYTLIMIVAYSAIRYKTPWCMLGFLHGLILLAGVGATVVKARWYRILVLAVFIPAVIHLGWQAYSGCYRCFDDHANPYVYAHPTSDVFRVVRKIEEAAALDADGKKMYIEVICPGNDCWPLPWYLRQFANVGYFSEVDMTRMPAPVIIAFASLEQQVLTKIWTVPPPGKRSLYVPLFDEYTELRPTIELRGYVINDLLEGRLRGPDRSQEAKE